MSWEDTFKSWSSPPGATEQTKCDNAVRAIRKAIDAHSTLKNRSIRVFAQGSYCNRTNVRAESDVDVCVYCDETMFFDLPEGMTAAEFQISTPASYSYVQYKNDVETALTDYFGQDGVTRGSKAFDVHENTYRVDADAVPCFEYRLYWKDSTYRKGTAFDPDKGSRIKNYPEQNYANGVQKNTDTGGRFKDIVRILKRLNYKMEEDDIPAAPIPSFLIESLVWNVPNEKFGNQAYAADVRSCLAHLFNNTRSAEESKEWCEVNDCKYLFRSSQPWTLAQAHAFTSAAWDYLGFG